MMVAVVVAAQDRLEIQAQLRGLLPAGVARLHFRDDKPGVRRRHLALQAAFAAAGRLEAVEAHAIIPTARRERAARERCLSASAGDLAQRGGAEPIIESRQDHQDQRDSRTLLACRSHGVVPRALQWRFGRPRSEPLLWPPDTLAGVLGRAPLGRDRELREMLPEQLAQRAWSGRLEQRVAPGSRSDRGVPGLPSGSFAPPALPRCSVPGPAVKTRGRLGTAGGSAASVRP